MNRYVKNVFTVAAAAVLLSSPALAARRTSLSNNQLIKDKDDVVIYPQLMLDYRNLINFDYGTSKGEGSGMLLIGSRDFGFGILVNRADINPGPLGDAGSSFMWNYMDTYELANLGAPGNPLATADGGVADGDYSSPLTFVDLIMAFNLGRNLLGFRLGIGTGGQSETADEESSDSQFALKLTAGMSFGKNMDLAADIVFASGQRTVGGDLAHSGSLFGINANLRGFSPMGEKIDLGYLGQFAFGSQAITEANDNNSDARNDILLVGGLGPVYKLKKMNSTVSAYGLVGIGWSGRDPNTDGDVDEDAQTDLTIIIPGFRMSLELNLLEWLVFRSGMEYHFGYQQDTEANGDLVLTQQEGSFGWNAGLGLIIGDFTLDGAIQQNWMTQGPDFLGGDAPMFLTVSANYTF